MGFVPQPIYQDYYKVYIGFPVINPSYHYFPFFISIYYFVKVPLWNDKNYVSLGKEYRNHKFSYQNRQTIFF
jgi:hypothetical protein